MSSSSAAHSRYYESKWGTGAYVIPPFDIFRIESNRLVWQGVAETLDVARLHIKVLMMAGEPGDYIIRSQKTGHETIVKADGTTERIA